MNDRYRIYNGKALRFGYTTGSCAAAAAKAAALCLLSPAPPDIKTVRITTPGGQTLDLELAQAVQTPGGFCCAVQKDGGDDPDVTHGLWVTATVSLLPAPGIILEGGEGVGRVTLPGLPVGVNEPAINPVPRASIQKELEAVARDVGYAGGFHVVLSIPGGEAVAQKTFNPRLGIVGGLSILGTTGLVEPMSERAVVDTIKLEITQRHAQNSRALLLTPGNYGMGYIAARWGEAAAQKSVKCANWIGEALSHAAGLGFEHILLAGHIGKLVKVAGGIMNTHSSVADGRMEILAAHAALHSANAAQIAELLSCPTTDAALALLGQWQLLSPVLLTLGDKIAFHLAACARRANPDAPIQTAYAVFSGEGTLLCASPDPLLDLVFCGL